MRLVIVAGIAVLVSACAGNSGPLPVILKPKPEPTKVVEIPKLPVEPAKPVLAIADDASTLQAWQAYRLELLQYSAAQRESLAKTLGKTDTTVASLQSMLLRLHPEASYTVRFKAQNQLTELLPKLPAGLAALLRWDLAYNQRLLESESAVKALTRLNSQQDDNLEKLQKQNEDLQKKIEALTQIEAKLGSGGG
mgnify:CR=1 FL=1